MLSAHFRRDTFCVRVMLRKLFACVTFGVHARLHFHFIPPRCFIFVAHCCCTCIFVGGTPERKKKNQQHNRSLVAARHPSRHRLPWTTNQQRTRAQVGASDVPIGPKTYQNLRLRIRRRTQHPISSGVLE